MATHVRHEPDRHRFAVGDGEEIAVLMYREAPGVITFVHTEVPLRLRGQGMGEELGAYRSGICPWEEFGGYTAMPIRRGVREAARRIREPGRSGPTARCGPNSAPYYFRQFGQYPPISKRAITMWNWQSRSTWPFTRSNRSLSNSCTFPHRRHVMCMWSRCGLRS